MIIGGASFYERSKTRLETEYTEICVIFPPESCILSLLAGEFVVWGFLWHPKMHKRFCLCQEKIKQAN